MVRYCQLSSEYSAATMAVVSESAPSIRPSTFSSGSRSTLARSVPRSAIASSTVPRNGQSPVSRQSAMYARSADSKPTAWVVPISMPGIDGSTAPSSTSRPTRSGKNFAKVAPRNVPYE